MAYIKYKLLISLLSICFIYSCNTDKETIDNKFYDTKSQTWKNYLTSIGMDANLNGAVFLFVQSSSCAPCLKELRWWDDNFNKGNVYLIVIEQFASTYNSFLRINDLSLAAHQDSTALAFEKELIPFVPVKLYFNNKAQVVSIERIGSEGNLSSFLKKVDME
ncbi:hypothetical protein [Fodinibius halophilus]|uniref:Thioredoxin family protein n=1 Tax=Fodinibius halophilus TaxID=1736908 RepID=A0A6M1T9D3_9BACT|nr:hypothetical protein [Fodinibius halophilus]NGP90085.1 hypothetical protein [Fodinibius halophilus]